MSKKRVPVLGDMDGNTWIKFYRSMDSPESSFWEKIVESFGDEFFTTREINNIRNKLSLKSYSPTEAALNILRNGALAISSMHGFCYNNQMIDALEILEEEFPETRLEKAEGHQDLKNTSSLSSINHQQQQDQIIKNTILENNLLQPNNNNSQNNFNDTSVFQQRIYSNLLTSNPTQQQDILNLISNMRQQQDSIQQLFEREQHQFEQELNLFETVLPVIEDKNLLSRLQSQSLTVGKFEIIHIKERKLEFKKREYINVLEYLKELRMIKHRHLNFLTAECIYKSTKVNNYCLLFNNEDSTTLTNYVEILSLRSLRPENPVTVALNQLEIVRDITAGLLYLHGESIHGKKSMIHGNLNQNCILITLKNNEVCAKITDFSRTKEIELNDLKNREELREEMYKFGLIVFGITVYKWITAQESDRLHPNPMPEQQSKKEKDLLKQIYDFYKLKVEATTDHVVSITKLYAFLVTVWYRPTNPAFEDENYLQRIEKYMNDKLQKSLLK
jgi:hypothetical protein